MPTVYFGKKSEPGFDIEQSKDLIAVRTRSGRSIMRTTGPVRSPISAELRDGELVVSYPDAGVEVYRVPIDRNTRSLTDRKTALRASSDVRFAGGVLVDAINKEPVVYTENLFVKFVDMADPDDCVVILRDAGLTIKNEVPYATNAYFCAALEGTGQIIFDIATALLNREDVEYCHPELIRPRARKSIFPQQWHLRKSIIDGIAVDAHANVESAHSITRGEGVTIAIIDDGIDIDHVEFSGLGKVVASRDSTLQTDNPRPKGADENHGTSCAGVACASGVLGASGVAPKASLLPIRLSSGLGSQREADAFHWAADNGADVISCSWGPPDGSWWDSDDPQHNQVFQLPASTRLAIDYAVANGRGGKGCVIFFAAGNGNESVDNDGYASYSKVIAVAACNDRSTRSVYSDFGKAVWCSFPSNDIGHALFSHPSPLTKGIWTTDRVGPDGYNLGNSADGDLAGNFTNKFGGTSSSCPGAAGIAALVLSINQDLNWIEVKELLKQSCDKIDPQGGNYDSVTGQSLKYGFGRLNALSAVNLAKPQPQSRVSFSRTFDSPILDLQTVSLPLTISDNTPIKSISVGVQLKHSYIGDLVITLQPPDDLGVKPIVLHNRAGGSTKDLNKTFDTLTTQALSGFVGKSCEGTWTLHVQDEAVEDSGTFGSFSINLSFTHPGNSASIPKSTLTKLSPKKKTRSTTKKH